MLNGYISQHAMQNHLVQIQFTEEDNSRVYFNVTLVLQLQEQGTIKTNYWIVFFCELHLH